MKEYQLMPIGAPPATARSGGVTKVKDSAAYKAVVTQAEKSAQRLKAINQELKQEPERALIGTVGGSLATGLLLNQADKMAAEKPDSLAAKNPNGTLVAMGALALGVGYYAASEGHPTILHAALASASTTYGAGVGARFTNLGRPAPAAAPAPAPAAATPKIQGGSDPFDVAGGPLSRAFARRLARQAASEQPSAVEGPDPLESYVGEILEDSGVAGVLDGELEVGALPLMLAPAALQQLLAMLPAMKSAAQAEQQGKPGPAVAGGVCWPMLADLSGFDGDVGATMAERQYRRQQRRIRRQERRLKAAKAKAAASPQGQQAAQAAELQALRAQVQQLQAQQAAQYVPAEAMMTEELIPVE